MEKWIIILITVLILITACSSAASLFKEQQIPQLTGPYKVGTILLDVHDAARQETLIDTGEARRLAIQVFYPAAPDSQGEFLPSMDRRISQAFVDLYRIPMNSDNLSLSHSIIEASAVEGETYPVILFSHGGFSFNTQNLSTFEELASQGYIVLAVSHTYEAIETVFSETESLAASDLSYMKSSSSMDKELLQSYEQDIEILKSSVSQQEKKETLQRLAQGFYGDLQPYLEIRLEDIHFVLSQLNDWNQKNYPFSGHMDLDKTGMFGHSLGGITTSYICSEENTSVQAGINLDAPVVLFPGFDLQLQRPFAFFYSTQTALPKLGKLDMTGSNSYFAETSDKEVYSLSFMNSAHYNFSDFNFMPGIMRLTPMLGKVNGPEMAKEMNRAILEFFNLTLKSDENTFYQKGNTQSELFTIE